MYPGSEVFYFGQTQSTENRRKGCHRFSLRFRHVVILISNIGLKENKRDGVDLNSDGLDYCVRKNEGKFLWFSADQNGARKI